MKLKMYQVDAFADKVFSGNPAAVCPLDEWLPDELLQQIAEENNLSETAFFVPVGAHYELRWFTPTHEVDLCGHATLASAHVLFRHLGCTDATIRFMSRSGELKVTRTAKGMQMDFPAAELRPVDTTDVLLEAIGVTPDEILADFDYLVVLESQEQIENLQVDLARMRQLDLRGVIYTAPGREVDFVSRCFFPAIGIDEDPVTGSAHCEMAPYWGQRLGKTQLSARQLSRRGGSLQCKVTDQRVLLEGQAADYLEGQIFIG